MNTTKMYDATETDRAQMEDVTVAVIGYGSQGHAHALNLRDSGVEVVVGLREKSGSRAKARAAGLEVLPVDEAVRRARVVALLIPDTAQPAVYRESVEAGLEAGDALLFAHGFNVHYGAIDPPAEVDTIMVAPKSPGSMLRREFSRGRGVPALLAVHQDATGQATARALAYADAIGSTRAGVLRTTFGDETETDLFGEQAVLCGGLTSLVKAGFETLVEAGYSPELAYFECLHEMKLIVDLCYRGGLSGMRRGVSDTAEFGDYVSGPRVVGEQTKEAMRDLLREIRSGAFAREWVDESESGGKRFEQFRVIEREHPLEDVGRRLRERMVWLHEEA